MYNRLLSLVFGLAHRDSSYGLAIMFQLDTMIGPEIV